MSAEAQTIIILTRTAAKKLARLVTYWNKERAKIGTPPTDPNDYINMHLELDYENVFGRTPRRVLKELDRRAESVADGAAKLVDAEGAINRVARNLRKR